MTTAVEDLKSLRNWTLGIVAFATTVATVLVQALHFRPEPTIIAVAGFACALVLIVILIQRSENRQRQIVEEHVSTRAEQMASLNKRLDVVDSVLLEIQRSTLRTEMNNAIARHPENHDTILKMAEKYFLGLDANWVQVDLFQGWMDKEKEAGRPVNVPIELLKTTQRKQSV